MSEHVQRWRERRDSYRPAGEPINTLAHEVAALERDAEAKAFVVRHHYSGSYPAARRRFGLHRGGVLVGVAVFSQPVRDAVVACLPGAPAESLELGRFVLLDEVPANGETWFLGRCFELLRREGFVGVVSFSDPFPRTSVAGAVVHPGHVGTIYQAHNAVYLGRSRADTLRFLPDGRVLTNRAVAKVRALDRGWRYVVAQLESYGATPLTGDPRAWLAVWLPRLTRPVKHPGNHKYAWTLQRRNRRHLPASKPYPKLLVSTARAA
jgi:hypothetical protein